MLKSPRILAADLPTHPDRHAVYDGFKKIQAALGFTIMFVSAMPFNVDGNIRVTITVRKAEPKADIPYTFIRYETGGICRLG